MEGNRTVTVGELLRCRSPLSVHHDSSPYKRKRSPGGDGLPQNEWNGSPEGNGLYQNDAGRVPSARNQPHLLPCVVGRKSPPSGNLPNLLPLSEEPSLLVGRIQLWNSSLHSSACSSTSDCLAFSDDSATVCCALRDFDPQLLGRLVCLLSWSYIPEREGGGALEIRQLELAETSGSFPINSVYLSPETASVPNLVLETPPFKQKTWKPRLVLAGCVSFISPPFAIPYGESRTNLALSAGVASKVSDNKMQNVAALKAYNEKLQNSAASKALNAHLLGFFLGLSACNHKPSCLPPTVDHCYTVGIAGHGNQKPSSQDVAYIFFSGSPAAWRPIVLSFSGRCISITGLRRKVLMAGEERTRYTVYAATSTSTVSGLCTSSLTNVIKRPETGSGDCVMHMKAMCMVEDQIQQKCQQTYRSKHFGSYIGVVTEMFVRGRLLELDGCVWLLLTHQPLSQVHGLRVGATVAAFHVHFLNLTSFSESTLLLAACSISHLVVTHFSPLKTLYAGKRELQSCLSRFIESLPFLSAFWALQIIASFKQKFRGFYNEKEILGSAKNKGIAENYLRNLLDVGTVYCRDVVKEFFSHNICRLAESVPGNFSLQVPPIRNFCKQIQILWLNQNSCIWSRQHRTDEKGDNIYDLGARRNTFIRRVLSSNTLGVTLLGFLQFSKVVGKLQLLDATGAIDVVIPDLQTAQYFQLACQVTTYKLVIEGYLEPSSDISLDMRSFPLSWYTILKGTAVNMEASSSISLFLIFSIKEACFMEHIRHPTFSEKCPRKQEMKERSSLFETGKVDRCSFDMLFVLHKYPVRSKSFGKQTEGCNSSFCVEAVRLPYSVHILDDPRGLFGPEKMAEVQDSSVVCTVSRLCQSRKGSKVHGMSDRLVDGQGHAGFYGYTNHHSLLKESNMVSESKMRRLLQFSDKDIAYHEVIEIGQCFLVESLPGSAVMTVHTGSQFLSLVAEFDGDTKVYSERMQKVTAEGRSKLPLVDVILKLPSTFQDRFNSALEDARAYLSPVLSVREVLDHGKSSSYWEHVAHSGLLKGSLTSFCGMIESFKSRQSSSFSKAQCMPTKQHRSFGSKMLFVKDLRSSHLVKVTCDPDQHGLPVGLGPGAVVAMHRALLQLSANGDVILKCIPSTLIVVCSVRDDRSTASNKTLAIQKEGSCVHDKFEKLQEEPTRIDATFGFDCTNSHLPKLLKIQCRVLSVEKLLIERDEALDRCMPSLIGIDRAKGVKHVENVNYRVSHVSLTIDDGSGLAYCWARDETAAGLLNLPLQSRQHPARNLKASENMHLIRQLKALVRKYGTILLHSINHQLDFSSDSIVVQGGKDGNLNFEEKKIMYAIVRRACHAGPLDIVAEHWLSEGPKNQLCGAQWNESNSGQNKDAQWPRLLARKVEAINYERHLTAISEDLVDTIRILEDSTT